MIHYIGHSVDIVPRQAIRKGNRNRSWKYGYNPEWDIVVISKDGTIGDIYHVSGINIAIPQQPDKAEILNADLPKKQQVWKRQPLPPQLNVETQFEARFKPYIEQEYYRREHGVFVKINGHTVYMPGLSYYLYQFFPLDEGYANFRVIQNELMIFWEACVADQRCYGMIYTKNRRFGFTSIAINMLTEAATKVENKMLGLMSKTGTDSRSMFQRLVRGFKKLPSFFTPLWDGTTSPKTELLLQEPTRRKATDRKVVRTGDGLDTVIKWYTTVLNSMDGERIYRSVLDESGKYPKECPFDNYWSIVKTSHRVGARIVGKSMVASTVNAMNKGGRPFKNVYYQSDPMHRSKNGQTQSGLYKLFIPAQYCMEGYFDKYGFSVVDDPVKPMPNEYGEILTIGANTYIDNELEMLEDKPELYNEFLRQFPRQEAHAFRDASEDCNFDITKLYEQLDYNDHELDPATIQRGNFHWKDGVQDSQVVWSPDPNGRFKVCWHPSEEYRNRFENITKHYVTGRSPIAEHVGAFGCDPYNRSQTVKKEGSKGSIHLYLKNNLTGAPCNQFVLEYIDRPQKVEFFFEDVIKAMVYYSMPVLVELSNENMLRYIKERGYRHYMMNRPDRRWKDLSATEKEFGGVPAQNQAFADAQFYAVEAYINDHIGVARSNQYRLLGTMGTMPFSETLECWKDVDVENRTKYDAYISSSLALLANQRFNKERKVTKVRRTFEVKTYNHAGRVGKIAV